MAGLRITDGGWITVDGQPTPTDSRSNRQPLPTGGAPLRPRRPALPQFLFFLLALRTALAASASGGPLPLSTGPHRAKACAVEAGGGPPPSGRGVPPVPNSSVL